jgi:UDPglucose--hexose-1-phosphate uridylyltransferase
MPVGEIETAFSVYRSRFSTLLDRPDIEAIVLFRNHGSASGASLVHPHAQLVGLSVVPPWLEARERWARERYEGGFKCVTCAELDLERHDSSRLIEETEQFVASVPFAATVPSEIMIIPKRHCGSFAELSHTETLGLAALLRRTLRRLNSVHGDPPYNLFVDPALRDGLRQSHSHWRLRIVPDLAKWGGFERATHMPINPSCPEEDAARLREAIVKAEATP